MEYFIKSLKIFEEIDEKNGICFSINNIGTTYSLIKRYKEAEEYCLRSLKTGREMGFPENISNASWQLSKIYKLLGKYKESLEMFELYKTMSDSINNQETQKASVQKQMQYEFEKKESQTKSEQDKKDVIASEKLKQQKLQRNYFITGFGLVLILAGFIFRSYRQKHEANKIITAKKEEVEKQKNVIEAKQKEILDSIHYAKRIQTALLPSEKYFERSLNKLFKS